MKLKWFKLVALCLTLILLCASLMSCGREDLSMEGKKWNFSVGVDENGKVVYCTKGVSQAYPDAKIVTLSCSASGGVLTLKELASGDIHKGEYSFERSGSDADFYHVSFTSKGVDHGDHVHAAGSEEGGHASVSCVENPDGGKTYVMTMTFETVKLTFMAPYES